MNRSPFPSHRAPLSEEDFHALVDGRLAPESRARAESWLAAHPDAATAVAAWKVQRDDLHRRYDAVLDEPVPNRLLDAVRSSESPRHGGHLRYAAVVAWLALGAVIGGVADRMLGAPRAAPDAAPEAASAFASLPRQAAIAHAVFTPEVKHPVDVGADQEAHLATWLSKRLGAPVKPPHLDKEGFALMGGRLLPDAEAGAPVAQFMYQDANQHRVTLYLRRNGSAADHGGTAFHFAQEGKVNVFYWIEDTYGYALSSELPRDRLASLATAVYRQTAH
jgi:anti-sigma factor RsiW